MRLWTWQTPEFHLDHGTVDHEQSEYVREIPGVREAYIELSRRLGTDQLVWCCTARSEPWHKRLEWILDVPPSAILATIDDIVWNRILGKRCGLPRDLLHEWNVVALRRHPTDPAAMDQALKELEEEFWMREPPKGGWWNGLFVDVQSQSRGSAIIRHPVRTEWIIQRPRLTL